ncbi:MAG: L-proline dehydrogenase [Alcaligenaceae bacterium]|nr:MAG: L-proline dehydrogenase [Alcaligenaceae bacterium]
MQFLDTTVARATPWVPRALIRKISRRYIAGDTLSQALVRVRQLNAQGFSVTLDVLGETLSTLAQAQATADVYHQVLNAVHAEGLLANISIKPSALGLLLDAQRCEQLILSILDTAEQQNNSVCLDMEDASCTQKEIDLFGRLRPRSANVGLALQAYLLRTYQDIEPLVHGASTLRICKGIYAEDRALLVKNAWSDRSAINDHFLHHVVRCFEAGSFVGIATHDAALIARIVERVRRDGIDHNRFEFQMLLGVCEPLRDKLLGMGFNVRIYVPFGTDWYGYSKRRLNESPRIAGHIAKALIGL